VWQRTVRLNPCWRSPSSRCSTNPCVIRLIAVRWLTADDLVLLIAIHSSTGIGVFKAVRLARFRWTRLIDISMVA
jgi:hypothetical protein